MSYRVNWDNGASACGTFPNVFDTHEDADAYGREWADECNLRDFGTVAPDEDCYTYEVLTLESLGEGDEEDADEMGELRKAALNMGRP